MEVSWCDYLDLLPGGTVRRQRVINMSLFAWKSVFISVVLLQLIVPSFHQKNSNFVDELYSHPSYKEIESFLSSSLPASPSRISSQRGK